MTKPVVDTTAAGDSFAAAYIAARLAGADPVEAAAPGIVSPALWYAIPARSSRARRCRQISSATPVNLSQGDPMNVNVTARQEKLADLVKSATVIPVLTIERLEHAVPLARALVAGGVRMLEVTLRTPVAIEAAKAMIAEVPEAIVGIGTILNPDDLKRTEALGAKFGISPGATPELLKAAAASALAVRAGDRDGVGTDAGAGARF